MDFPGPKTALPLSLSVDLKQSRIRADKLSGASAAQGFVQFARQGGTRNAESSALSGFRGRISVRKIAACSINVLVVGFDPCLR
jgi:hypothetical protein